MISFVREKFVQNMAKVVQDVLVIQKQNALVTHERSNRWRSGSRIR